MTVGTVPAYPVQLDIDYPQELDRFTTLLRLFYIIPIAIVAAFLSGVRGGETSAGGFVVFPTLIMIVFRRKYPRWWFDWNLLFLRFSTRVWAYAALLTDVYPSTDEEQSVHLTLDFPDAERDLNRWLPLIKWALAIPHYIALIILGFIALLLVIAAWFAILFTGRYPPGIFRFVVGLMRWETRVAAYAFLLTTDRYPPFSLDPD